MSDTITAADELELDAAQALVAACEGWVTAKASAADGARSVEEAERRVARAARRFLIADPEIASLTDEEAMARAAAGAIAVLRRLSA